MAVAEPTLPISIDLATLSGWANVASGSHTLTIKAKADGYLDSPASVGVTFEKGVDLAGTVWQTKTNLVTPLNIQKSDGTNGLDVKNYTVHIPQLNLTTTVLNNEFLSTSSVKAIGLKSDSTQDRYPDIYAWTTNGESSVSNYYERDINYWYYCTGPYNTSWTKLTEPFTVTINENQEDNVYIKRFLERYFDKIS